MLRRLPTRDDREPVVGRGEGGDDTTVIDRDAESAAVARLEALAGARHLVPARLRGAGRAHVRRGRQPLGGGHRPDRRLAERQARAAVLLPLDRVRRRRRRWTTSASAYVRDFGSGRGVGGRARPGRDRERPAAGRRAAQGAAGDRRLEATNAGLVAEAAGRLDGSVGRIRVLGALALALCQLADGRVDGVATLKPSRSVDLAAAALVVREAGSALLHARPSIRSRSTCRSGARAWPPRSRCADAGRAVCTARPVTAVSDTAPVFIKRLGRQTPG